LFDCLTAPKKIEINYDGLRDVCNHLTIKPSATKERNN